MYPAVDTLWTRSRLLLVMLPFLFAACTRADGPASEGKPLSIELQEVFRERFEPVSSFAALPAAVRNVIERRTKEPMANPGGRYQATDVISEALPTRRFVVAGGSSPSQKFWVVCYEHGGFAHHHHVALLARTATGIAVQKAGQWQPGAQPVTLERAINALQHGEVGFDDHW
jgi:hypothetical protein